MLDEQQKTAKVIESCCQERSQDHREDNASPACVELFRRAFAGDQEAWSAIQRIFERLMYKWIGVQQQIEPEDVLQEAIFAFFRFAPQVADLTATNDLSHALGYLRTCVKTALLTKFRQSAKQPIVDSLDIDVAVGENPLSQVDLRLSLEQLLETDQERLVFHLRFVCNIGPKYIFEDHSDQFADYQEVATIIQRLTRRFRGDKGLQDWGITRQKTGKLALHEMRMIEQGNEIEIEMGREGMQNQCTYREDVLLDYLTGLASVELRLSIEQSPACLQAAQVLAKDIGPWLLFLHRMRCPDITKLIAYQQKQLSGTERLVLHKHIEACPLCQEELTMLDAVDAVPLEEPPTLLRRIVEAVLRSPLASPQPLRGELQIYETATVTIHVTTRKNAGKARTWLLRGQVRTAEGQLLTDIEQIVLDKLDGGCDENRSFPLATTQEQNSGFHTEPSIEDPTQPEAQGAIDKEGFFTVKELTTGFYRLRILTTNSEIIIRKIAIGTDE